ncbi:MAG: hypothetical protein JJU41_01970 [Bacteroidetes bacterium]|nr:hypothetical protein [Bacteroidota bacterium]MCH8523601.1 SxtJ family membrane protein [Balneolales bacterium]
MSIWHNIPVDNRKVREFGLVIFFVIGVLVSGFIFYKNDWAITPLASNLFKASGVFMLVCMVLPRYMFPIYKAWMLLALGLGFIATRVIITLVYLLMMTPVGVIRRQKKGSVYRTYLDFNPEEHQSYWIRRDEPYNKEHTERQF